MEMEKRLIIAIVFSILIVLTFQYLMPKHPTPPQPVKIETESVPIQKEELKGMPLAAKDEPYEEKEYSFETDRYILTFSNIGGSIKNIKLKNFKDLSTHEPLALVALNNPEEYIFAVSDPMNAVNLDKSEYAIRQEADSIIWSARVNDFVVNKKYNLRNSKYGIELELSIKNISSGAKPISYRVIGGAGLDASSEQDKKTIEMTSKMDSKISNFKRPKTGRVINNGVVDWQALKSRYFSLILKPFATTKNQFYNEDRNMNLVMGVEADIARLQPGETLNHKYIIFAGPSQIPALKEFGHNLEETVNYGFFGGITKIIIAIMHMMFVVVRNWGASLILLSIFLNIILFPLTMKSFKSMQKMQELNPQIAKLKAQCKDNPQKLNKEIMELYKKYKVNPLSGCLPILLQMPIFFALYQALMKSIELRGAHFLWIRDLSAPEAIKLPASLPLIGNTINILPLIMVVAMVVQQKISTKTMGQAMTPEQAQQQKMMLIIMPIVFGFIFYSMPSGLVLYWLVNTVLTLVEQATFLKSAQG